MAFGFGIVGQLVVQYGVIFYILMPWFMAIKGINRMGQGNSGKVRKKS